MSEESVDTVEEPGVEQVATGQDEEREASSQTAAQDGAVESRGVDDVASEQARDEGSETLGEDDPAAEKTSDEETPDEGASGEVAEDSEEESDDGEDVDPLEEEGDIAADYLEELLDIADLDGDIDTYVEGSRAHISIVTDSQTLVGRDGKVLEALQELSRLAVMTETGHRSRLMLDVAGFRDNRRKELLILATDAIESVKESGEPAHLAPMNPFERKIVHDAAAAAGLTSESEGVEPKRHVVISKL